jgi:hypothetical protein
MLNTIIRDYRIVLLATLNPIIWDIVPWTMSENLFCFSMFGVTTATQKAYDSISSGAERYFKIAFWIAALCFFIVVGCLARYFFATFAVVLYGATLLAYGRRTALAILPAYVLSAGLFLALIHHNSNVTGFGTGMERLPAPESTRFLLIYFSLQSIRVTLMFIPVFLILWPEYFTSFTRARIVNRTAEGAAPSPLCGFMIFSGLGYLALQFLTRFFFAYDLFSYRLIGPGFVLLTCGLAMAVMRGGSARVGWAWFGPSAKTLALAVYCLLASEYLLPLGQFLSDWRPGGAVSARALILNSKAPATTAKVIFPIGRPFLSPVLMYQDEFFYGADKTIVYPSHAPAAWPDTAETYRAKLQKYAAADCALDFTELKTEDDLNKQLSAADYDVDVNLAGLKVSRIKRPSYDPSLKEFLSRVFRGSAYVSCQEALAGEESR